LYFKNIFNFALVFEQYDLTVKFCNIMEINRIRKINGDSTMLNVEQLFGNFVLSCGLLLNNFFLFLERERERETAWYYRFSHA
jgi:hypothetical protein